MLKETMLGCKKRPSELCLEIKKKGHIIKTIFRIERDFFLVFVLVLRRFRLRITTRGVGSNVVTTKRLL